MPSHIVDVSARSRLFREQQLLSHAWVASPHEVLAFLQHPRSELKKLGIRLPSSCAIETVLQNHDWLSGRSDGLADGNGISVFARGEGDGERTYRVSFYASKARRAAPKQRLLHRPDEEEKPANPATPVARIRAEAHRRSMLAAPLHLAVHEWLSPLTVDTPFTKSSEEAHRIFVGILELVDRLVAASPAMQSAMVDVASYLQRPFHPAYSALYRAQSSKERTFHQAFAGVMYAKANWILQVSGYQGEAVIGDVETLLEEPEPALQILRNAIESLDPDFIPHATVEATIRRRDDTVLAERLGRAEHLFHSLDPLHPERSSRFSAPARRLELFAPSNRSEWWFLPGLIAFAMSTWPAGGGSTDDAAE